MVASSRFAALGCGTFAILLAGLVFNPVPLSAIEASATTAKTHSWSVRSQPVGLVNGSPVVFLVTPPRPLQSLSGRWLEHEVFFSADPEGKGWY